jgi:hypothetical protein
MKFLRIFAGTLLLLKEALAIQQYFPGTHAFTNNRNPYLYNSTFRERMLLPITGSRSSTTVLSGDACFC